MNFMNVPTDREQVHFEDWDESALRRIISSAHRDEQAAEDEAGLPE